MISFGSAAAAFGALLSSLQPCLALPASAEPGLNHHHHALIRRADPQFLHVRITPPGAPADAVSAEDIDGVEFVEESGANRNSHDVEDDHDVQERSLPKSGNDLSSRQINAATDILSQVVDQINEENGGTGDSDPPADGGDNDPIEDEGDIPPVEEEEGEGVTDNAVDTQSLETDAPSEPVAPSSETGPVEDEGEVVEEDGTDEDVENDGAGDNAGNIETPAETTPAEIDTAKPTAAASSETALAEDEEGEAVDDEDEEDTGNDSGVPDPGLPEFNPTLSNTTSSNDTEPDDWLCSDGTVSGWTPELWNEHNVGRWLVQRCELYNGQDAEWPTNGGEDNDNFGVPRTIAFYDGLNRDNAFSWPGTGCITATETCDLSDEQILNENCARFPERAFTLWAMRNFVRLIQSWLRNFEEGISTAQQFTPEIVETFLLIDESAEAPPSAWLTTSVGAFSTAGAFLKGKGAGSAGLLSGLFITASGASSFALAESPRDPRFTKFSEFQSSLGEVKKMVEDSIVGYFNQLFVEVPPHGDWERATELARLLEDGTFADQDIGGGVDAVRPNTMADMIQASMISEAWNGGRVAIVKWSTDGVMANDNWNPCGEGKNDKSGMDKVLACVLDKNYLIMPMMVNELSSRDRATILELWVDVGQSQETLEKFNLSQEKVILASERTQERTRQFIYKGLEDLPDMFQDVVENPGPSGDISDDLLFFNVPVCDLDTIEDLSFGKCGNDRGDKFFSRCITQYVSWWCSRMKIEGSDAEWPYQLDDVVD